MTENVKDFTAVPDLVLVCVLKSRLRPRGMATQLASLLEAWAAANPRPYVGAHWPSTSA